MSELKCPFCGKKLWYDEQDGIYRCMKSGCVMDYEGGTEQLWQELIRTRKALDVAKDAIDKILYLDSGKFIQEPAEMWKIAKSAKDKITALEQKDAK